MRHNKSFNHLGRKAAHRSAMLSNMATSLILHKRISTTVAKAKALKTYVEPLITKSKVDSTHSRRVVFSYLQNKDGVNELFRDIAVKVANRPGGYTRILKTGNRVGDNAEMCIIELVDYNENYTQQKESAKQTSSKRRRSSSKKKTADAVTAEAPAQAAVETVEAPVEEAPEVNETVVDETVKPVEDNTSDEAKKEE
ncbi:MAG: 50S ribosomal protein L17 [Salinivirgaceae bacterium]